MTTQPKLNASVRTSFARSTTKSQITQRTMQNILLAYAVFFTTTSPSKRSSLAMGKVFSGVSKWNHQLTSPHVANQQQQKNLRKAACRLVPSTSDGSNLVFEKSMKKLTSNFNDASGVIGNMDNIIILISMGHIPRLLRRKVL